MRIGCRITIITSLLLTLSALATEAAQLQPARIGEHDTSLAKRIQFPNVPGNYTTFIRCEAKVLPAGNIDAIACYNDKEIDDAFYRAVQIAGNSATVLPATADGENVGILMLFSVIFRQQDGEQIIAVVPNHGTNAKNFGISYIAPQRYGRSISYTPRTELGLLWVDAQMSASGEPGEVKYIKTEWSNKEAQRYAKAYMRDCNFIPGHLNGEPTAMRFVKPIYGYRTGFTWDKDSSRCGDSLVSCDETSSTTGKPRFVFED